MEVIKKVLEAGRLSPSSKNTQPWHFVAIRDKGKLARISALTPTGKHIEKANFAIAVFMDHAKLPEVDGTRAMQNLMLCAWDFGVSSCWVANFEEDRVKDLLRVPREMKLLTVVPFGYPTEARTRRKKVRKAFAEVVHWEEFGRKSP